MHIPDMCVEMTALSERFLTDITQKGPLPTVKSQVCLEVCSTGKSLRTQVSLIVSHTCVYLEVGFEMRPLSERFGTQVTGKWFLAGVEHDVYFVWCRVIETVTTDVTAIWLLTCVQTGVDLQ